MNAHPFSLVKSHFLSLSLAMVIAAHMDAAVPRGISESEVLGVLPIPDVQSAKFAKDVLSQIFFGYFTDDSVESYINEST